MRAEELLRAGRESCVHPVTGLAMRRALESDALQFEIHANQLHQIDAGNDDLPSQSWGRFRRHPKSLPHQIEDFPGKESDLPFVVIPVIEKAIAPNATSGDAFNAAHGSIGKLAGRTTVLAEIIVPGRRT